MTMLAEAASDGRLSADEHSERTERALSARTLGDLAELTADLAEPSAQPLRLDGGRVITGMFGSQTHEGRWVVPDTVTVSAIFGEAVVDFRSALLQTPRVVLYATAIGGRVRLIVPDGVAVVVSGTAVLGRKRGATAPQPPADPDAPAIEVRAFIAGGEVRVVTPVRQRRWLQGRLGRWASRALP